MTNMTLRCATCQAEVPASSKFCMKCGAPQSPILPVQPYQTQNLNHSQSTYPASQNFAPPAKVVRSPFDRLSMLAKVLIGIGGALLLIFLFGPIFQGSLGGGYRTFEGSGSMRVRGGSVVVGSIIMFFSAMAHAISKNMMEYNILLLIFLLVVMNLPVISAILLIRSGLRMQKEADQRDTLRYPMVSAFCTLGFVLLFGFLYFALDLSMSIKATLGSMFSLGFGFGFGWGFTWSLILGMVALVVIGMMRATVNGLTE